MKRFLIMWLLLLIIIHQVLSSSSSSSSISNPNHLCPHEHRLILLQFKQMFVIHHNAIFENLCRGYDEPYYPKTLSWNKSSTNCCSWDGVTCDYLTGDVIGIDLGCSQLSGTLHPNTTLFQLPLTSLDLSFNNFQQSSIPSSIGMLAPTLTHLNISYSNFTGSIPSEIAHLSKLVLLRLSDIDYSYEDTPLVRLEQHDFQNIISNLTQLEILDLENINIPSSIIPDSIVNLTSLTSLVFINNGLYGQVPDGVFNLPALQKLYILDNYGLKGSFHNVNWNISGTTPPLEDLRLSSISLSGGLPDSIGHLRSLNYLVFEHCNLSESLPGSIGNLSQLNILSLRYNNLTGLIPHSLSNLNGLTYLLLSHNQFEGQIPDNISNLTELYEIDLSFNNLNGTLYLDTFSNTKHLDSIILSNNGNLLVVDADGDFSTITSLDLSSCKLQTFPIKFFTTSKNLRQLDLSNTGVSGQIPECRDGSMLGLYCA